MTIHLPVTFEVGDGVPPSTFTLALDRGALQGAPRRTRRAPRIPRDPARAAWEVAWRAERRDHDPRPAFAASLLGRTLEDGPRTDHAAYLDSACYHRARGTRLPAWRVADCGSGRAMVLAARLLRLSPEWVSLP